MTSLGLFEVCQATVMTMKNKYAKRAHISERKFRQTVRLFATGLETSQIAKLTNLSLALVVSKAKEAVVLAVKQFVFGIFQHNGHIYTEIVPNCSKATLQTVIRGKVELERIIYSDLC